MSVFISLCTSIAYFIQEFALILHVHNYLFILNYSALQKYWNSKANSFIFAVDWKHLGLTSKDEYEMRD